MKAYQISKCLEIATRLVDQHKRLDSNSKFYSYKIQDGLKELFIHLPGNSSPELQKLIGEAAMLHEEMMLKGRVAVRGHYMKVSQLLLHIKQRVAIEVAGTAENPDTLENLKLQAYIEKMKKDAADMPVVEETPVSASVKEMLDKATSVTRLMSLTPPSTEEKKSNVEPAPSENYKSTIEIAKKF